MLCLTSELDKKRNFEEVQRYYGNFRYWPASFIMLDKMGKHSINKFAVWDLNQPLSWFKIVCFMLMEVKQKGQDRRDINTLLMLDMNSCHVQSLHFFQFHDIWAQAAQPIERSTTMSSSKHWPVQETALHKYIHRKKK